MMNDWTRDLCVVSKKILNSFLIHFGRSFTKRRKRRGPMALPWGTLLRTSCTVKMLLELRLPLFLMLESLPAMYLVSPWFQFLEFIWQSLMWDAMECFAVVIKIYSQDDGYTSKPQSSSAWCRGIFDHHCIATSLLSDYAGKKLKISQYFGQLWQKNVGAYFRWTTRCSWPPMTP